MRIKNYVEELEVPEGITIKLDGDILIVNGPKGELKRRFFDPRIKIAVKDNVVVFSADVYTKKEKMQLGSFVAHIKNMFYGVKEAYTYKLKICSGHFPMNVSVKGNEFTIKNYIGEKVPRVFKFSPAVKVTIEGEIVTIVSCDIELAGQTACLIEQKSLRPGFDKRVFQQGIFITEKPKKVRL